MFTMNKSSLPQEAVGVLCLRERKANRERFRRSKYLVCGGKDTNAVSSIPWKVGCYWVVLVPVGHDAFHNFRVHSTSHRLWDRYAIDHHSVP